MFDKGYLVRAAATTGVNVEERAVDVDRRSETNIDVDRHDGGDVDERRQRRLLPVSRQETTGDVV